MAITRDEWLKALDDVGLPTEHDEAAITAYEFAAMFGMSTQTAMRRLKLLRDKGRAVETRKLARTNDGRTMSMIAFRLVDKPAKAKRA